MNLAVLVSGAAAAAVAALCLAPQQDPVTPTSSDPAVGTPRVATITANPGGGQTDAAPRLPPELHLPLPPHARIALRLPRGLRSGLRCPDGSFLPLLNGVPHASPIHRSPHDGPLPPVVARRTDADGDDWYEHADGSLTTTRWVDVEVGGVVRPDVVTSHHAPVDAHARPLPSSKIPAPTTQR